MTLQEYRKKYKLTWEELANKIGVNRATLLKVAYGKNTNPTLDFIDKVYKKTGLTYHEFIIETKKDKEEFKQDVDVLIKDERIDYHKKGIRI